jgi:hypothetical protein
MRYFLGIVLTGLTMNGLIALIELFGIEFTLSDLLWLALGVLVPLVVNVIELTLDRLGVRDGTR